MDFGVWDRANNYNQKLKQTRLRSHIINTTRVHLNDPSTRVLTMPNKRKSTTVPIPTGDGVAHVPNALPVPATNRPKQKTEPARTSKTSQKLVVFPEAELDQRPVEQTLQEGGPEDLRRISSESQVEQKLRRVTAYLTAEYHHQELLTF